MLSINPNLLIWQHFKMLCAPGRVDDSSHPFIIAHLTPLHPGCAADRLGVIWSCPTFIPPSNVMPFTPDY